MAAAASAVVVAVAAAAAGVADTLEPVALAVGQAWATELVHALRSADRDIVGAWPGTLREARMRIRAQVRARIELDEIERLARIAYVAARRDWQQVSEPDLEP